MFEIKNPRNGLILQVAEYDFHSEMNYYDAKKACEALGDGWRLPTIFEAELMYKELHLKRKGNFEKKGFYQRYGSYWCEKDYNDYSKAFSFSQGYAMGHGQAYNGDVRVVRDFEKKNPKENIKVEYVKKIKDKYSKTVEYRMPDSIILDSNVYGEIDLNMRVFVENSDFMSSKIVLALTYYAPEPGTGTILHESVADVMIDKKDIFQLDNYYSYSGLNGSYYQLEIYDEVLGQKSRRTEQIQFNIDLATLIKFVNARNIEIRVNKKNNYEGKIYFEQIVKLIGFYNGIFDPDFKIEELIKHETILLKEKNVDCEKYKLQITTPPPPPGVTLYSSDSKCFIITATMNDPYHPIVDEFRAYRDSKLLTNILGKAFVSFYYIVGPFAALVIRKSPVLRKLSFRLFVSPVYKHIKNGY
jgi:hypothetical protein